MYYKWNKVAVLIKVTGILLLVLAMLIILVRNFAGNGSSDLLAYTVSSHDRETPKTSLMLYDPRAGVSVPVYTNPNRINFSFSADRRLAFSAQDKGQLYKIDTSFRQSPLRKISQNPTTRDYPLAWSPDGRYLALVSYLNDREKTLNIWDGKMVIDITPSDVVHSVGHYWDMSWSPDDRLAFTVWNPRGYSDQDDLSEIYLWNGKRTVSLSQNPAGSDANPIWSVDGRLAFLSTQQNDYDVYVWDGVSVLNDSPNRDTFTKIAPNLTQYYSTPVWTHNGFLAFKSQSPPDTHAQIYLWDGQTATNISQNPTLHNGSQTWSANGHWAFSTFFSPQQLVYVRDAQNNPLETFEGQFPAWSSSGYLTFCKYTPHGWVLSIWDGQRVVEVAQGSEIIAQWQNGSRNVCSSG